MLNQINNNLKSSQNPLKHVLRSSFLVTNVHLQLYSQKRSFLKKDLPQEVCLNKTKYKIYQNHHLLMTRSILISRGRSSLQSKNKSYY